jgi:hypothetical protein
MAADSPHADNASFSELRAQLQRQWNEYQYAVAIEQAEAVLDRFRADPELVTDCVRLKIDLSDMIWDIAVADDRRNLLAGCASAKKRAQNTVAQARRRAPRERVLDDPALTQEDFERYCRASFHPGKNTVERLTKVLGKYSNPPGDEREPPQSIRKGRRAEVTDWLMDKLNKRLCQISSLGYEKRIELLGRILTCSGFLHPKTEASDTYEAAQKKLSRMNTRRIHRSHHSK